jgi:uncharacterized protein (DUF2225 family)
MTNDSDNTKESINEILAQYLFKCDLCDTKFDEKTSLNQHLKTHNIEK